MVLQMAIFSGCSEKEIEVEEDKSEIANDSKAESFDISVAESTFSEEEVAEPKTDVVSDLADKDYLLPLDVFSRAREHAPEFVMIHFTSAVVLSKDDPYNKELVRGIFTDYEVSVHYIIDRDGNIDCYVPEELVAYHAGRGEWNNDEKYTNKLNDYSIGIEIMAIGSQNDMAQYMSASEYNKLNPEFIGYTDAQYDSLKLLVKDICDRNNIPMDRQHIIGHEEYSPAKTDPGELFDWERLLGE
jgi:N-acetylmuramoyl-L-alanine amidase